MSMDSLPRYPDYHDALAVAGLVAGRMIKKRCMFRVYPNLTQRNTAKSVRLESIFFFLDNSV